jgi:hypothetical protein
MFLPRTAQEVYLYEVITVRGQCKRIDWKKSC